MRMVERFYPEARYGGFSDVDGTVAFYARVKALLAPGMTVLDVGCGRGTGLIDDPVAFRRDLRGLRGQGRTVIGIDVDPDAATNPGIDEFRRIGGDLWPVSDGSVDLIVSDFVLEHVRDPVMFFGEVVRVLKLIGVFCARTSNRMGYVAVLASLIPTRWHSQVVQTAQRDREEIDIFPTHYRVNTTGKVKRALKDARLDGVVYGYDAESCYFEFSAPLFAVGKCLHALLPRPLRNGQFVFARKA